MPPCRTPLYAPTGFDFQAAAARSAQQPTARLELEHVHGYAGAGCLCPGDGYGWGSCCMVLCVLHTVQQPLAHLQLDRQHCLASTGQNAWVHFAAGRSRSHIRQDLETFHARSALVYMLVNKACAHSGNSMCDGRLMVFAGFDNTAPNLFYTYDGGFVYYTAGIGVVCAPSSSAEASISHASTVPAKQMHAASKQASASSNHAHDMARPVGAENSQQDLHQPRLRQPEAASRNARLADARTDVILSYDNGQPAHPGSHVPALSKHGTHDSAGHGPDQHASGVIAVLDHDMDDINTLEVAAQTAAAAYAPVNSLLNRVALERELRSVTERAAASLNAPSATPGNTMPAAAILEHMSASKADSASPPLLAKSASKAGATSAAAGQSRGAAVLEDYPCPSVALIHKGQAQPGSMSQKQVNSQRSGTSEQQGLSAVSTSHNSISRAQHGDIASAEPAHAPDTAADDDLEASVEHGPGQFVRLTAVSATPGTGASRYADMELTSDKIAPGKPLAAAIKDAQSHPEATDVIASGRVSEPTHRAPAARPAHPTRSSEPLPPSALPEAQFDPNGTAAVRASMRQTAGLEPESAPHPASGPHPGHAELARSTQRQPGAAQSASSPASDADSDAEAGSEQAEEECVQIAVSFVSPAAEGRYSNLELTFDKAASQQHKPDAGPVGRAVHAGTAKPHPSSGDADLEDYAQGPKLPVTSPSPSAIAIQPGDIVSSGRKAEAGAAPMHLQEASALDDDADPMLATLPALQLTQQRLSASATRHDDDSSPLLATTSAPAVQAPMPLHAGTVHRPAGNPQPAQPVARSTSLDDDADPLLGTFTGTVPLHSPRAVNDVGHATTPGASPGAQQATTSHEHRTLHRDNDTIRPAGQGSYTLDGDLSLNTALPAVSVSRQLSQPFQDCPPCQRFFQVRSVPEARTWAKPCAS